MKQLRQYDFLDMEIVYFSVEDIVRTSNQGGNQGGDLGGGEDELPVIPFGF